MITKSNPLSHHVIVNIEGMGGPVPYDVTADVASELRIAYMAKAGLPEHIIFTAYAYTGKEVKVVLRPKAIIFMEISPLQKKDEAGGAA